MTFAQKGSIAFAIIILGLVLDAIGFQANEIQTENTIADMKAIMTLIPIVGIASSLVIIYFYPIDAKMHKELLKQLKEER
jgi:GPH family glycoside/pentoside/hexuronide:cation symporter